MSKDTLYVGLDVHAETIAVAVAETHGRHEVRSLGTIGNTPEAVRKLLRKRRRDGQVPQVCYQDQTRAGHRISKFLLRRGLRRPAKTRAWGSVHIKWLHERRFALYAHQATMVDLLAELQHVGERLERLERAIDHAIERLPEADQQLIQGLQALRGLARTTAVTIVSELGRFSRFDNPRQLMAYIGLVPSEHSSGSKRRLGAITKTGNSHVRRVLIEASWAYRHRPSVRGDLLKRQKLCSEAVCTIANKAQHRLNLRYRRLNARKPTPVAITAIARELLGFVWAVGCQLEREIDTDAAPLASTQRYVVNRKAAA